MRFQILCISLLLIAGCAKQQTPEAGEQNGANPGTENTDLATAADTLVMENDTLLYIWTASLKSLPETGLAFDVDKELIKNTHSPWETDTIKTLAHKNSEIMVYVAESGIYEVLSADIANAGLSIGNFKVGMLKSEVENEMEMVLTSDRNVLTNKEQSLFYEFQFENGRLSRMRFKGTLD